MGGSGDTAADAWMTARKARARELAPGAWRSAGERALAEASWEQVIFPEDRTQRDKKREREPYEWLDRL